MKQEVNPGGGGISECIFTATTQSSADMQCNLTKPFTDFSEIQILYVSDDNWSAKSYVSCCPFPSSFLDSVKSTTDTDSQILVITNGSNYIHLRVRTTSRLDVRSKNKYNIYKIYGIK